MKIEFDSTMKIAGIGLVPWTRLGPERWFKNYKIASLYGWDIKNIAGAPEVVALADRERHLPTLPRLNTQSLLNEPSFQQLITAEFPGYDFITYKSINPPHELTGHGRKFLGMNQELTKTLENKTAFRELFADLKLPIPAYRIIKRSSVKSDEKTLHALLGGREKIVMQDESLSGGRGTFVVQNVRDLKRALDTIQKLGGGQKLVISEYIPQARERSVQCVVTRYGTFVGYLQKQIIGDPFLANVQSPDGDRFCGGEISAADPLISKYPEIKRYALKIGDRLHALGYRGIFSLDCLVDNADNVYVLEINPRITGMTPLVTALYREDKDVPFYLLHMLELAGADYSIIDEAADATPPEGSLLILHSHKNAPVNIMSSPVSGLYNLESAAFEGRAYRLSSDESRRAVLIQQYTPPGFKVKPGGRLLTMISDTRVTDDSDRLSSEPVSLLRNLEQRIELREVIV